MAEQTGSRSPFSAFGSNKPPKPVVYPWLKPELKPSATLATGAIKDLDTASAEAKRRFDLGMPKQESLQSEQEGVLRNLLDRALNRDPNQLLKDVGQTAFSFIAPNVVDPLARADASAYEISRRAAGLNPAAIDSTAERLRRARIGSERYYDVARQAYAALPNLYNQVYGAGLTNADLAAGYIPKIASGYRDVSMMPLIPATARAEAANLSSGIIGNQANAAKAATYGFQQPKNIWDRLGDMDSSLWGRLGEAVQMYSSIMGGGLGGMGGGSLGGMGGGGGGGAKSYGANSVAQPSFQAAVPSPQYTPNPSIMNPQPYYNPNLMVNPYGQSQTPSYIPNYGGSEMPTFG